MLPQFLLPETTIRDAGSGPEFPLGEHQGKCLVLTLGITRIVEQESIDLSVWGSADGTNWGNAPIAAYPQKFYCGTYQLFVDLSDHPEITHLRVNWTVNRWGKGSLKPMFGIYVFAQAGPPVMAAVG
jgi:hypothetical protein